MDGDLFFYFQNDFSALELQSGPYHVPRAKNFVSMDSFYYPKQEAGDGTLSDEGQLWLFQFTEAETHPVNGEGLAHILDRLGLLEIVRKHGERVALIFVVPKENAGTFGHQKIELETSNDEVSVRKLDGIGAKRQDSLKDEKVYTIGQLRGIALLHLYRE